MALVEQVDVKEMPRETWLEFRRGGIGGSEAAAVMGLHPYDTPLSVYYAKLNGAQKEETLAMEVGKELEPFLRRKFEQWLKENEGWEVDVQESPYMLANPDYPFMFAHIDGQFTHPEHGPCGLEIKTAGEFQRNDWGEDELPDHYYIQVQHYMAVTGLQQFYVAYLIGNRIFNAKPVPRNEEVMQTLVEQLGRFWSEHVLSGVPPAPRGLACDTDILKQLYPKDDGSTIELHRCQDRLHRYKELKKQEKELKMEMDSIRQYFMAEMGDAAEARVGNYKVTYKTVESRGYTVPPSSSRVLRIS